MLWLLGILATAVGGYADDALVDGNLGTDAATGVPVGGHGEQMLLSDVSHQEH